MKIIRSMSVGTIWSGHPVGFDLLTHGDRQFVAYYDAERKMTVGMRILERMRGLWLIPKGFGWRGGVGGLQSSVGTVIIS